MAGIDWRFKFSNTALGVRGSIFKGAFRGEMTLLSCPYFGIFAIAKDAHARGG